MSELNSINDIQTLVRADCTDWSQHGDVSVKQHGDLLQFNYSPAAQFAGRWNWFERVSRGLILHAETGNVVARPFDKFFNYGENGRYPADGVPVLHAWEKMDGSLGIIYHHEGKWRVATRGSLESEQAQWATEFLHQRIDTASMVPEWTYLAEIIYPGNRIVVDYGHSESLSLLAMRHRGEGVYLPWRTVVANARTCAFDLPADYSGSDLYTLLAAKEALPVDEEGYVVEFMDGSRWKIKGNAYVEMHRLISGLSFKNTLQAMQDGTIDDMMARIPDEFLGDVREWRAYIEATVGLTLHRCKEFFDNAPKGNRKAFAAHVLENYPVYAPYLFAMLDGKDIVPMICRMEFRGTP